MRPHEIRRLIQAFIKFDVNAVPNVCTQSLDTDQCLIAISPVSFGLGPFARDFQRPRATKDDLLWRIVSFCVVLLQS
jgi:hypothetical protein